MKRQSLSGNSAVNRLLSRRQALRAALLGTASIPLLRWSASAQTETPLPAGDYALHLFQLAPTVIPTEVVARKGNLRSWPVLQGVSIAQVEVPVGTWRSPHLHTNTAELAVVLNGQARVALQNPQKEWLELDLQAGDCVYFPMGWPHWFRNSGVTVLKAYFNYGHELPVTVELPE